MTAQEMRNTIRRMDTVTVRGEVSEVAGGFLLHVKIEAPAGVELEQTDMKSDVFKTQDDLFRAIGKVMADLRSKGFHFRLEIDAVDPFES